MDSVRKKELLEEYKNRRPKMGVISYHCRETGESFLGISKDTQADFNSNNAKLTANYHPNKRMQELWNTYGQQGFETAVLKILKYEDPHKNHTVELEKLREQCFTMNPRASKIWL